MLIKIILTRLFLDWYVCLKIYNGNGRYRYNMNIVYIVIIENSLSRNFVIIDSIINNNIQKFNSKK